MPVREVTFRPELAVETLLFLAERLHKPTVHELLKLRYFADKLHLAQYGTLASGDEYVAMEYGPVASNIYHMLRAAAGKRSIWIHPELVQAVEGVMVVEKDGQSVSIRRVADASKIPESDLECLESALAQYGNMPFDERTELSHDDAWKAAYHAAKVAQVGRGEMPLQSIIATLPNANEITELLSD